MERRGHMRISFRGRLAAASNVRCAVDALGNAVFRSFDPFGNVAAEWGAAYPVRRTYDTQGRRTLLATTRDGISWDVTRWAYDPRTGSCVSKTYADGSAVLYAYTPDNLPLRTTYASGRWIENVYDARRQVIGTVSCDGSADAALARDPFRRELATAVGNAVGGVPATSLAYAYDALSRPVSRNADTFAYNARGEVAFLRRGAENAEEAYSYDFIGNSCRRPSTRPRMPTPPTASTSTRPSSASPRLCARFFPCTMPMATLRHSVHGQRREG